MLAWDKPPPMPVTRRVEEEGSSTWSSDRIELLD